MKKFLHFLLVVFLAIAAFSCSTEKRLYNNGWYWEKKSSENGERLQAKKAAIDFNKEMKTSSAVAFSANEQRTDSFLKIYLKNKKSKCAGACNKKFAQLNGDSTPAKHRHPKTHVTYADAKSSLASKGAVPNRYAKTLYLLSVAAIPLMLLSALGIALDLVVIVLSYFATKKIIASSDNVEENLAIVNAARRTAVTTLICFGIAAVLFFGLLIYLAFFTHAFV